MLAFCYLITSKAVTRVMLVGSSRYREEYCSERAEKNYLVIKFSLFMNGVLVSYCSSFAYSL